MWLWIALMAFVLVVVLVTKSNDSPLGRSIPGPS